MMKGKSQIIFKIKLNKPLPKKHCIIIFSAEGEVNGKTVEFNWEYYRTCILPNGTYLIADGISIKAPGISDLNLRGLKNLKLNFEVYEKKTIQYVECKDYCLDIQQTNLILESGEIIKIPERLSKQRKAS